LIIDFEGEPSKSIGARKLKYCPLKDVSGMLRSFHYAIYNGYFRQTRLRPEDIETFQPWIEPWYKHVAHVFLKAYLETAGKAKFIPNKKEDIELLIDLFIVDKAVYEIGYELNNRPDWISIPMQGLKYILQNTEKRE
jgi:maltose alpha-D-glucosyltransferase/alpha-amylase